MSRRAAIFWSVTLAVSLGLGCGSQVTAPKPPPPKHLVLLSLVEVNAVQEAENSYLFAPTQLTPDSTLRISGSYRPADLKADLPIVVSITQISGGKAVTCANSATADIKIVDSVYSFVIDTSAPQKGAGEYDLVVNAGNRFIAHGKVTLVPGK